MKPRHAAALALVGWYLMMPPFVRTGNEVYPDDDAPLSKWRMAGSFDSAGACQQKKDDYIYHPCILVVPAGSVCPQNAIPPENAAERAADIEARCIGTDDPRLKGN